jgi:hypothetical protein
VFVSFVRCFVAISHAPASSVRRIEAATASRDQENVWSVRGARRGMSGSVAGTSNVRG